MRSWTIRPPMASPASSDAVQVTKISWRGAYSRLVQLSDSCLITLHPSERQRTNQWDFVDILSVRQLDTHVLIQLAGTGSLCGLARELRLALPTTADAMALQVAIQWRLVRKLTGLMDSGASASARDPTAHASASGPARGASAESDVIAALDEGGLPALKEDGEAEEVESPRGMLSFDVHVAINKARSLPSPSFIWPNAVGAPPHHRSWPRPRAISSSPCMAASGDRRPARGTGGRVAREAAGSVLESVAHAAVVHAAHPRPRSLLPPHPAPLTPHAPPPMPPHSCCRPPVTVQCFWGAANASVSAPPGLPWNFSLASSTGYSHDPSEPGSGTCASPISASPLLTPVSEHRRAADAPSSPQTPVPSAPALAGIIPAGMLVASAHPTGAPVFFTTGEGQFERANPRWSHEAAFSYGATHTQLRGRVFELRVCHMRWPLPPLEVGSCSVRLDKIASGPMKYDLPIVHSRSGEQGRIVFTVQMIQRCRLTVELPIIQCTMRSISHHTSQASQEAAYRESAFSVTAGLTAEGEVDAPPARADFDPTTIQTTEKSQVRLSE